MTKGSVWLEGGFQIGIVTKWSKDQVMAELYKTNTDTAIIPCEVKDAFAGSPEFRCNREAIIAVFVHETTSLEKVSN